MSCVKYRNCAWIGRLSKSHQKICKNSIAVGCCAKYYSIIWPMLHDYVCRNKLFVINDWGWCVSEQSHHSEYGVLLVRMHTVASVDVSKYIILCALYLLCDVYWIALSLFLSLCVWERQFSRCFLDVCMTCTEKRFRSSDSDSDSDSTGSDTEPLESGPFGIRSFHLSLFRCYHLYCNIQYYVIICCNLSFDRSILDWIL